MENNEEVPVIESSVEGTPEIVIESEVTANEPVAELGETSASE